MFEGREMNKKVKDESREMGQARRSFRVLCRDCKAGDGVKEPALISEDVDRIRS